MSIHILNRHESHSIIRYDFINSAYGRLLMASTDVGLCHLFFVGDDNVALCELKARFPQASLQQGSDDHQKQAHDCLLQMLSASPHKRLESTVTGSVSPLQLHVQATPFQVQVWQVLLAIPCGQLTNYGELARQLGKPQASRAIGNAVGRNPIALLIPCHRVVRRNGDLGGYRWGVERKARLLALEAERDL